MTSDANTSGERISIGEVLPGLNIHPLLEGESAVEAFVLIKTSVRTGRRLTSSWSYRTTKRLNREELLGALVVQVDVLRKELLDEWCQEE